MMTSEFTFAVCAYKDSPYLEEALACARKQSIPVRLIVTTSTPSEYIRKLAEKYQAEYIVNPEKKGIASDWNFALAQIRTPYGAILHQDDVYFPEYAAKVVKAMKKTPDVRLVFTDYGDLLSDGKVHANRLYLWIKRFLLWGFYLKRIHHSRIMKQSAVVFGNAVSCPTVAYHLALGKVEFDSTYSVNLDWAMWLKQSREPGAFAYIPEVLMAHRIAESMETASAIADNRRYEEDFRIFESIWGRRIAGLLMKLYKKSYSANAGK